MSNFEKMVKTMRDMQMLYESKPTEENFYKKSDAEQKVDDFIDFLINAPDDFNGVKKYLKERELERNSIDKDMEAFDNEIDEIILRERSKYGV